MRSLFIFASLLFALNVNVQVYLTNTDTLTDADTLYLSSARQELGQITSFQINITNLSGTTSFTAKPEGSMDNQKWVQLADSYTYTLGDTVTIIQTPETFSIYVRIRLESSGSQSTKVQGIYKVER